ncbi:hypothetical protein [Scytonema sp. PCC 10023]|uniref:hypothetical protein n=1 Tax=Scytonema sp. PCC 10023 TaxID=1680591 RepID=UPI0039C747DF
MKDSTISPASIFIPAINDFVQVQGAVCQIIDGKNYLRLLCKTSIGAELLINPSDLEIYFKRGGVPF